MSTGWCKCGLHKIKHVPKHKIKHIVNIAKIQEYGINEKKRHKILFVTCFDVQLLTESKDLLTLYMSNFQIALWKKIFFALINYIIVIDQLRNC